MVNNMYILLEGKIEAHKINLETNQEEKYLDVFRGDYFGDYELLENE